MGYELNDAAGDVLDMRSTAETIENASYEWGAPNIELAAATVKRALSALAGAIEHWTGETMPQAESGNVNAFVWLEHLGTPDGTFILDIANTAQEITDDLFRAHHWYQNGDTLKALDIIEKTYKRWGTTTVNALIGAMRAQLLQPSSGSVTRAAHTDPTDPVVTSPSANPAQQG